MPNILDKMIETLAPRTALRRAAARSALKVINSGYANYGANVTKKSMRGWAAYGGSAKEDIEDNISILRQRSRDAYMGVPVATGAIKTKRTNVVGSGLVPTPQPDGDFLHLTPEQSEKLQAQILREFYLWADTPLCDADRVDSFWKLQQLAFLGYLMNGDAVVLLPMKHQDPMPYDLRVRIVEADRLCSPDMCDVLAPTVIGNRNVASIVQGVEMDGDGAVVAYWICSQHPLAGVSAVGGGDMKWQRVEAYGAKTGRRNVLHIMARERAGQLRGVPMLAPVLEAIKQLGRYTEAELMATVVSALFTVIIEKETASDATPIGEAVPEEQQIDAEDENSIELGNGAIIDLNPGEKANFANPPRPNANFDDFFNAIVKQIGTALEIPEEVLFKKFSTSYSAARGALNEFWRTCGMERDQFAEDFCQPIYEEWFAEAVARGRINAPGFFDDIAVRKAYTACTWNGPARTNLNPEQEVSAAEKRVQNGFSTAEQETAQMTGGSFAVNMRQRRIEQKLKQEVDSIAQP